MIFRARPIYTPCKHLKSRKIAVLPLRRYWALIGYKFMELPISNGRGFRVHCTLPYEYKSPSENRNGEELSTVRALFVLIFVR